ncbi:MAG: holo-ACP synthase [Thermoguttaceae bacterium]|jgi:holo-[acyl-carrier protein] synthase
MILGHGIDIMELARIKTHLGSGHDDWADAVFSAYERAQADPPPHDISFYAGRYAAKEAVAKALGTGFSDDLTWLDIDILRQPTGAPDVRLRGGALEAANALGVTHWFISISHSGGYAVASAIAVGDSRGGP